MVTEIVKPQKNGWPVLWLLILSTLISTAIFVFGIILAKNHDGLGVYMIVFGVLLLIATVTCYAGLFTIEPNESAVLLLFGKYMGTENVSGFRWSNPFYERKKISLRVRNFDSQKLKVNDKKGNPVEISAVIVWKVKDTAQAVFAVDNYTDYVHVQSEAAIRHLATSYAYDSGETGESDEPTLRSALDEVSENLTKEIQERVIAAGVDIIESRINHLAYAPEIAHAMLQRQQAEAIIAARTKIVDGAVGMVQMALEKLKHEGVISLDEERKASMVSNLMVVLCSDRATTPIINAGSLY